MTKSTINPKLRKYLQILVVVVLIGFLVSWYFFKKVGTPGLTNQEAFIQDAILHIFGDTHDINTYPNRLAFHHPYLLVIKPGDQKTFIYNLDSKRIETEINEAVLDYDGTNTLKNQGSTTYFNNHVLNTLCEKGFIKSTTEILCLTKVNTDTVENKLINITLPANAQQDIYISKNIITDFSYINGQIYIGEHELFTKKNYLWIDEEKIVAPSIINFIYEMNAKSYLATYISSHSDKEAYYSVENNIIRYVPDDKIKFTLH